MQNAYGKIIALIFCWSIVFAASGQGVTTASISGRVTGSQGEGLPGATILAFHNPSGTEYGTSSRPDGRLHL